MVCWNSLSGRVCCLAFTDPIILANHHFIRICLHIQNCLRTTFFQLIWKHSVGHAQLWLHRCWSATNYHKCHQHLSFVINIIKLSPTSSHQHGFCSFFTHPLHMTMSYKSDNEKEKNLSHRQSFLYLKHPYMTSKHIKISLTSNL